MSYVDKLNTLFITNTSHNIQSNNRRVANILYYLLNKNTSILTDKQPILATTAPQTPINIYTSTLELSAYLHTQQETKIYTLKHTPDHKYLITGGGNYYHHIYIWNIGQRNLEYSIIYTNNKCRSVSSICLLSPGYFATGSSNGNIMIWYIYNISEPK